IETIEESLVVLEKIRQGCEEIETIEESPVVFDSIKITIKPAEITLKSREMFRDDNNEAKNIEVVGERTVDKCYFKMKDVSNVFDIQFLKKTILYKANKYIRGQDYVIFCSSIGENGKPKSVRLYLTCLGLMKVTSMASNNKTAPFIMWATKTFFVGQMGIFEQKAKAAPEIAGINEDELKNIMSYSMTPVSCVYLLQLGTVKDLRMSLKLPRKHDTDDIVYKFGETSDIMRRVKELVKTYEPYGVSDIRLVAYGNISRTYLKAAEKDFRKHLRDSLVEHEKFRELVVLNEKGLKKAKKTIGKIALAKAEIVIARAEVDTAKA
ncbi:MAG: hypothetical protein WAX04_00715, partial [Oscillospiraceae bacterium]